jgi:hypothetical protein
MKVSELIEMLQSQDQDAEVRIQEPTKCHWNRDVAKEILGVESLPVEFSEYYSADRIITDNEEGDVSPPGEVAPDYKTVVVICSSYLGD